MKRVQRVETKIIERLAGQADEGLDDHFRDPCPHQGSFDIFLVGSNIGSSSLLLTRQKQGPQHCL